MEQFLENLASQLTILEESERKRIVKRYQTEIESKKEDGMPEEEAINSLGSMEDLVSEIYSEYHVNKKYKPQRKSFGEKLNHAIQATANFLSDTCTEIAYYATHISNQSLETFFEVLLKVLLLVIAFLILKIPFVLLEIFFKFMIGFLFYPFNGILIKLSSFVIAILYLVVCIALSIGMFHGYAENRRVHSIEKEKSEKKDYEKEIKSSEKTRNYAFILLKGLVYLIAIIPMTFLSLALLLLVALSFFFVYKGVNIIGLSVVLIGFLFLSIVITAYIADALDNRNKNHTLSVIVSVIAIISGSILLVDNLMGFHYPKTLEKSAFQPISETLTMDLKDKMIVANLDGNVEFILDNSVKDSQILVELAYYDELYDVSLETSKEKDYLWIYTNRDSFEVNDIHYLYQNGFDDLKNGNIYDYHLLNKVDVKIYGNEKVEELLILESKGK